MRPSRATLTGCPNRSGHKRLYKVHIKGPGNCENHFQVLYAPCILFAVRGRCWHFCCVCDWL